LPEEYDVHATFNVADLIPFVGGTNDEAEILDLRTNPSQEGGDDEMPITKGPTTRAMARGYKRNGPPMHIQGPR